MGLTFYFYNYSNSTDTGIQEAVISTNSKTLNYDPMDFSSEVTPNVRFWGFGQKHPSFFEILRVENTKYFTNP